MRSSDNQTLTVQEDRKQIFCICSGETVNNCSVCAPAPVHCPHLCLTMEVEQCQHSCGCRKDRETGKHLGHPLGHQCPPRCCSGCDSQSQQGDPSLMGYFPCFLGEQGDMAHPCFIPAVLHHKSQLTGTKRC